MIEYSRKGGGWMLEIIWGTEELALCVKPIGVRAQGEGETDLPALLSRQLGCKIYPVHRLDQAVGGVMVFAKTERMAAKLSKAIQEGKLQKEYLAVLTKRPEEDSGELHDLLFHDRFKNKTFVVSKERKGSKKRRCPTAYWRNRMGGALCMCGFIPAERIRSASSLPRAAARWWETENMGAG